MKKSISFIVIGIIFLLIALIMYNKGIYPTYVQGSISDTYIKHMFVTFFIGNTGATLLITGIRDFNDIKI